MANFELTAVSRKDMGKGASRRLRKNHSLVPAIIYGGDEAALPLSLEHKDVTKALKNEAFYSHILTITIDGKAQKAVLKDLQRHPYKPIIMHMDFQRVTGKEKIHMHVPIHFINEDKAPGIKEGGIITHHMRDIEVVCLPNDLPEYIEVDVANLHVEQLIHLSEVKAPKGVEFVAIVHGGDPALAAIHHPNVSAEDEEAEKAEAEAHAAAAAAAAATHPTEAPAAETPAAPTPTETKE